MILSGIPSASTPSPPFPVHMDLARPSTRKEKPPEIPGGVKTKLQLTREAVSTSWLSFGTARRRGSSPSHFERGLKPARPGLSLGVFRRFGTMASIHAVASPNEVKLSATLYYCIKNASRGNQLYLRHRVGVGPISADCKSDIGRSGRIKIHHELIGTVKLHQVH